MTRSLSPHWSASGDKNEQEMLIALLRRIHDNLDAVTGAS